MKKALPTIGIEALYRYNQARADLARAIGQMEDLYAK